MKQGQPWRGALLLLLLGGVAAAVQGAPCQPLPLQPLAPGLWLVPAVAEDSDAVNRGRSSHLLLARDGGRVWAVGAGATPVLGARLRCTAQQRLGQVVDDLIVPWAHAELALGVRGLAPRRVWAAGGVAEAMAEQCAGCSDRLRQRLGDAASDLGEQPVRLPTHRLMDDSFRLGPFDGYVLPRAEGRVVTVLRHRASGVMTAHGLLWGDGPPDLRDGDLALVALSLQHLPQLGRGATRWVGESGALLDADGVAAQAAYVRALQQAAQQAQERCELDTPPPPLRWADHPRHALNWQRAWRQAEDAWLRSAPR